MLLLFAATTANVPDAQRNFAKQRNFANPSFSAASRINREDNGASFDGRFSTPIVILAIIVNADARSEPEAGNRGLVDVRYEGWITCRLSPGPHGRGVPCLDRSRPDPALQS